MDILLKRFQAVVVPCTDGVCWLLWAVDLILLDSFLCGLLIVQFYAKRPPPLGSLKTKKYPVYFLNSGVLVQQSCWKFNYTDKCFHKNIWQTFQCCSIPYVLLYFNIISSQLKTFLEEKISLRVIMFGAFSFFFLIQKLLQFPQLYSFSANEKCMRITRFTLNFFCQQQDIIIPSLLVI